MTLLSRRFKLEYNDASNGTTVIAETGQNTGALKINRHMQMRRQKDPDILKLWLEGTNFGDSIPTRKSEFGQAQNGTDEPEILYKQYDPDTDSFVTQGRYYAKNTGTINEDGQLALKLYSFHKYTARQSVDTGTTTTNVEDALNSVLPAGYVADVPAGATPPSVDGYSINGRREKGYHELTRDYKWTLTFTGELDSNNDYKVKYEPEGFGGTVDTIIENTQASRYNIINVDTSSNTFTVSGDRTVELVVNQAILVINSTGNDGTYTVNNLTYNSTDNTTDITVDENISNSTADGAIIPGGQAVFKAWEKDKTDAIINKVIVEGTSTSTGDKVTGTATNQTQIDNFGEKFLKVKRGYVESTTDAENIAEGYLVPGLDENGNDITKVPENGTVKTTAYSDNIVNDSFQVVGVKRNIEDTYTVAQQRNFWPEGATEIEFEFEQENLEEAARESENLRDERGRLYPGGQTNVGEQDFTGDTGSAPSDTNVAGSLDTDVTGQSLAKASVVHPPGRSNSSIPFALEVPQILNRGATTKLFDGIQITITVNNFDIDPVDWTFFVIDSDDNTVFSSGTFTTAEDQTTTVQEFIEAPDVLEGENIDILVDADSTFSSPTESEQVNAQNTFGLTTVDLTVQSTELHEHNDSYDTNDNKHGGTKDDAGQHGTSGTTDPKKVDTTTEEKTDR